MSEREPEAEVQQEIVEQAEAEADDPVTSREELELDLMEEDVSELGEELGQPTD